MLTRTQDRQLRLAWTRFDRLTAYGCRERGREFDVPAMQFAWDAYQRLIRELGY